MSVSYRCLPDLAPLQSHFKGMQKVGSHFYFKWIECAMFSARNVNIEVCGFRLPMKDDQTTNKSLF